MKRDHLMGYTGHLRALMGDEFPQKLSVKRPDRVPAPPGHSEAMAKLDRDETKNLPNPKAKKAPRVKLVGQLRITYNGVGIKGENEIIDSGKDSMLVSYKKPDDVLHSVRIVIDGKSVPVAVSEAVREAMLQNTVKGLSIGFREPEDSPTTLQGRLKNAYDRARKIADEDLDNAVFELLKANDMYVEVVTGRWKKVGAMTTSSLVSSCFGIERLLEEFFELKVPKKSKAKAKAPHYGPTREAPRTCREDAAPVRRHDAVGQEHVRPLGARQGQTQGAAQAEQQRRVAQPD